MNEIILDVCCGGRQFWFNKENPNTIYMDNRVREKGHNYHRINHEVKPDIVADFRKIPFDNNKFRLVVFDPPHIFAKNENGVITKQSGYLNKETWKVDLLKGFNECIRVLQPEGVLVFKWNECRIKKKEVLDLFPLKPLFGHPSGSKSKTHWLCFMKILE